jgi:lysophospholipase L1-like esterase
LTAFVVLIGIELSAAGFERATMIWEGEATSPLPAGPTTSVELPDDVHAVLVAHAETEWALPSDVAMRSGTIEYKMNSEAMRAPDIGPRKGPRSVRLLTLGDSTVWGDRVYESEVFSAVLAQRLTTTWGCPVEAFNGGVPGFDSGQALQRMKRLGPRIEPDIVVVATIWSDLVVNRGEVLKSSPTSSSVREGLRRFAVYRVARHLLGPALAQRQVAWLDSPNALASVDDARPARVALAQYIQNLAAIAGAAAPARVIFLALPAPIDVGKYSIPPTILNYRAGMRRVSDRVGAEFVDAPAKFAAEPQGRHLFIDQVHPNRFGHALLADILFEWLESQRPQRCGAAE